MHSFCEPELSRVKQSLLEYCTLAFCLGLQLAQLQARASDDKVACMQPECRASGNC